MNYDDLKSAVLALEPEDKKRLILETFPELSKDAIKDPSFIMQLFPVFLSVWFLVVSYEHVDLRR